MRCIRGMYVADGAIVTGDVVWTGGVNLWFGVIIRGDLAKITLGANVNLQDGCIVHTDFDVPQVIESGVVAGHGAVLHGTHIGADTLIGMRATLLSGSAIGPECVIAAGTVVPERMVVPPRSVVMGVPGRVVRAVTDAEIERTYSINLRYRHMAERYHRGEIAQPLK